MVTKNYILTKEVADRKLQRMALEIAEQISGDETPLVLIGIKDNGMVIAGRIFELLQPLLQVPVSLLECNINKKHPIDVQFGPSTDFTGKHIVVVDDVTNTGRTLLYALKPLLEFYPKSIRTLSLVERMHKTFPIQPDFVGLSVATTLHNHIQVEVANGVVTGAFLE